MSHYFLFLIFCIIFFKSFFCADPVEYVYHMSLLMNYSYIQHKAFIKDYYKVPGIVSNPCLYAWPLNHNYINEETVNFLIFALGGCNGCNIDYFIVSYSINNSTWKVNSTGLLHKEKTPSLDSVANDSKYEPLKSGKIADPRGYRNGLRNRILYIFETDNGRQQLLLGDLCYDEKFNILFITKSVRLNIENEIISRHEKNWMPFIYRFVNNKVNNSVGINNSSNKHVSTIELFVHSIFPHRIVHPVEVVKDNITSYDAQNVYTISLTKVSNVTEDQLWPYGPMHGGSNAILIMTKYGYKYLTIFHSHSNYMAWWAMTYFFGFYLFDPFPPFKITHISPVPIVPNAFYNESTDGWSYKAIDYIVFPIGLIKIGDFLYISSGRHDRSGWILVLSLNGLIDSLKNVSSEIISNNFRNHMIAVYNRTNES